ncbi:hypothetical protein H632_c2705p1 [Helicosporidium sp. ATCC 50920]|nr:hypothetical protein H632_c2705p1 [Helicosporidium sp. ATCC 50920]|eukprot:KDD72945.1 hypothetical protein H632_c2705p1 [Helicosporidium sp. ATCC 50920]
MTLFRKHQTQLRSMVKGMQEIPVPLTGNRAAVAEYAKRMEALKKKVGMPTVEELLKEQMAERQSASSAPALDAMSDEQLASSFQEAVARVDLSGHPELEAKWTELKRDLESYDPLSKDEKQVKADAAALVKKYKTLGAQVNKALGKSAGSLQDEVVNVYEKTVKEMREEIEGDIERVRKEAKLDWMNVDLAKAAGAKK